MEDDYLLRKYNKWWMTGCLALVLSVVLTLSTFIVSVIASVKAGHLVPFCWVPVFLAVAIVVVFLLEEHAYFLANERSVYLDHFGGR